MQALDSCPKQKLPGFQETRSYLQPHAIAHSSAVEIIAISMLGLGLYMRTTVLYFLGLTLSR